MAQGLIILYTGEGKGKTTAALGLALRALGYGWKVIVLQFGKEEAWPSGERKTAKQLANLTIKTLGSGFYRILGDRKPKEMHQKSAREAFVQSLAVVQDPAYSVVILDEIVGALSQRFLTKEDIEVLLQKKRKELYLVLTGHHAPRWLIEKVDLATQMRKLKHPFDKGMLAVKGIDF